MTRDEAVVRLAIDPEFAARLAADPAGVGAQFGLSADDLAFVRELAPDAESVGVQQLGQRLSRSSIAFGSVVSHLLAGTHGTAADHALAEQQHPASSASPLDEGHDRSEPDLPQQGGPALPVHDGPSSAGTTPFHTGGPSGGGVLPSGQSGDDLPTVDVTVHHDDHRFGADSSHAEGDKPDAGKVNPGDPSNRGSNETTTLPDGSTSTAHVDTGGHITSIETRSPDGTVSVTSFDQSGHMTGGAVAFPDGTFAVGHPHQDGGPDGGTEGSGPAVDPAWASQQHTGPGSDPELGQEHGGPTLDPAATSKLDAGGSGTGGEGGTEESHDSPLKPGEASAVHVHTNDTGYGTASYGKVDPNPVS